MALEQGFSHISGIFLSDVFNCSCLNEIRTSFPNQVFGFFKTTDPCRFSRSRSYLFCHLFVYSSNSFGFTIFYLLKNKTSSNIYFSTTYRGTMHHAGERSALRLSAVASEPALKLGAFFIIGL